LLSLLVFLLMSRALFAIAIFIHQMSQNVLFNRQEKKIQSSYKAVLLEGPYLIIGAILIKCDSCNKISAVK